MRANVARLREARGLTKKDLADRTQELGRPVPPLGISRIEAGTRRVDADDLVALADALNVSPLDLLLPPKANGEPFSLTNGHAVTSRTAWLWALGRQPAFDWEEGDALRMGGPGADPAAFADAYARGQEFERLMSDYRRFALPRELHLGEGMLVGLVRGLENLIEGVVGPRGTREDRAARARVALRRLEQIKLSLEEVNEILATGGEMEDLARQQHPWLARQASESTGRDEA